MLAATTARSVRSDRGDLARLSAPSESDTAMLMSSTAVTEFAAVASAAATHTTGS